MARFWRSIKKLCTCGRNDIIDDQLVVDQLSGDNSAVEGQAVASNSDVSFYSRIKSTSNRCQICNMECTTLFYCQPCNARRFQSLFKDWTSGNQKLDEFIQNSQLAAKKHSETIEFIPYERFRNIRYETDGGFGRVYSALWKPSQIETYMEWDGQRQDWNRGKSPLPVALKKIEIFRTVSDEFIKALAMQIRLNDTRQINHLFGISRDPETNEYVLVTAFHQHGSLRQYIEGNYGKPSWDDLLALLTDAAEGLHKIHNLGCIHKNFHTSNVLVNLDPLSSYISDLGISHPADVDPKDSLYGVLPFIAPELLHGGVYTPAADIYSFGMIMFEAATGELPFQTREYNLFLTIDICNEVRPEIPSHVPQCFAQLIERCWDTDPNQRPSALEITVLLSRWNLRRPQEFAIQWEMSNRESSMSFNNSEKKLRVTSQPLNLNMNPSPLQNQGTSIKARESEYSDDLETEKIYLFKHDLVEDFIREIY